MRRRGKTGGRSGELQNKPSRGAAFGYQDRRGLRHRISGSGRRSDEVVNFELMVQAQALAGWRVYLAAPVVQCLWRTVRLIGCELVEDTIMHAFKFGDLQC